MKKFIKVSLIILSSAVVAFSLLAFIVVKDLQKGFSQKVGKEVKLIDTVKAVTTLNYDGEKEKELKKKGQKEKIHQITVYYYPMEKGILPLTKETLQRADQLTKKYLGNYTKRPVDLIYMEPNDLKTYSPMRDAGGVYSDFDKLIGIGLNKGDIESILEKRETPLYRFQKVILHEYTHYATHMKLDQMRIDSNKIPVWFMEGIADYIGENEDELDFHSFEPSIIELERLETQDQWDNTINKEGINPYLQGYFTVSYLIHTYGEDIVIRLVKEMTLSKDFYQSLQKLTGRTKEEFENDVIKYYQ